MWSNFAINYATAPYVIRLSHYLKFARVSTLEGTRLESLLRNLQGKDKALMWRSLRFQRKLQPFRRESVREGRLGPQLSAMLVVALTDARQHKPSLIRSIKQLHHQMRLKKKRQRDLRIGLTIKQETKKKAEVSQNRFQVETPIKQRKKEAQLQIDGKHKTTILMEPKEVFETHRLPIQAAIPQLPLSFSIAVLTH